MQIPIGVSVMVKDVGKTAIHAKHENDARLELQCVRVAFECEDKSLKMSTIVVEAVDGFRLSRREVVVPEVLERHSFTLTPKQWKAVQKAKRHRSMRFLLQKTESIGTSSLPLKWMAYPFLPEPAFTKPMPGTTKLIPTGGVSATLDAVKTHNALEECLSGLTPRERRACAVYSLIHQYEHGSGIVMAFTVLEGVPTFGTVADTRHDEPFINEERAAFNGDWLSKLLSGFESTVTVTIPAENEPAMFVGAPKKGAGTLREVLMPMFLGAWIEFAGHIGLEI